MLTFIDTWMRYISFHASGTDARTAHVLSYHTSKMASTMVIGTSFGGSTEASFWQVCKVELAGKAHCTRCSGFWRVSPVGESETEPSSST